MIVADSKAGKTTALASLANAGYKLRILDFDDGLDVLHSWVDPSKLENIDAITLKDDPKSRKGAKAWRTGWNIVTGSWTDPDTGDDLGTVSDFDSSTVLVVDSLSYAGRAAMNNALSMNGKKFSDQLSQPEWGQAMRDMESFLDHSTGPDIACNLVVTAHPTVIEDDSGVGRVYPKVVSKSFGMNMVSPFFNNVIGMKSNRKGERFFRLTGDGRQEFAVARQGLGSEMPADLAELFRLLRGGEIEERNVA